MEEANEQNNFLTMAYYDTDGNGILATQGMEPAVGARLSDLAPEGRSVVKAALEGRRSVSRLFQSEVSDQRIFVYSVPVYDGEATQPSEHWPPAIISKSFPISCRAARFSREADIFIWSVRRENFLSDRRIRL